MVDGDMNSTLFGLVRYVLEPGMLLREVIDMIQNADNVELAIQYY